ncbi:uncharacterized protein DFL_003966 [Arthrobotrys flagrans]|uniref:Zinc/iron permease n=1 Tax=Arthrobotrys flagrans TaxID=97331 RepID=A0A437A3C8_ARTFL|nr:hypothetical protein DFL_003966 [Arthrobotrys flagrans]
MKMEEPDARAWLLTVCSALACCAGASVVFIDLLPWKHFSIQSNSTFLAACLSLSFSVLLFSSARLFGEAITYLKRGYGDNPYYIIMVSFSAGFLVCYYLFKFLHRFIPHRTVNCDDDSEDDDDKLLTSGFGSVSSGATAVDHDHSTSNLKANNGKVVIPDEETALLGNGLEHRPTLAKRLSDTVGKITRRCTEDGRCFGFVTCPCEGNCLHKKGEAKPLHACHPKHCERTHSEPHQVGCSSHRNLRDVPILEDEEHDHSDDDGHYHGHGREQQQEHHHVHGHDSAHDAETHGSHHGDEDGHAPKHAHHHHVANNAFVGIGFQTSLAIALHRCPDGFITFVTNHADKKLGFTIFLSLFIHSAVDGFTMCLPLYLALQSAWKAVFITFIIGGLAQPLGGLFAFIWLSFGSAPSETVYGIIFSFTAGLMSVVAVQLLRQIPSDHKHPDLPYISMLAGVVLMCLSVALTTSSS